MGDFDIGSKTYFNQTINLVIWDDIKKFDMENRIFLNVWIQYQIKLKNFGPTRLKF